MAKQKMLINVHEDESRIALTEDRTLVGLHYHQTARERTVGNIYRGTVVKVNPAFQAAFVDYGEKKNGFLSSSDLNPALFKFNGDRGRPRIQSVLRSGQTVMVQVLKEGVREKGAALTTFISLPGRYLVFTPNSERSGVSRKIEDAGKRHALRDILNGLQADDEEGGVIIRTAGIDRPALDLKRDLTSLRKEWKLIQQRFETGKKPGMVHQEPGSIVRVLRDYFTDDIEEVWVDSPEAYQEALAYIKSTLPKYQKRLRLYVGDMSLFSAHAVEDQIEALTSSRVPLKSGGSLVIESTEALVAIDVNSGKSNQESDIEDTALRTNLEAAQAVARQLRLRNLGGLIVVDFIDMFSAKNRTKVQQAMVEALKGDKARTTVGTISQFGLLELSRQRIDMELSLGLRTRCPTCNGTGNIPTVTASANAVLRKIRALAATGKYSEVHGDLPLELANHLLNHKREGLRDLEMEFDIEVHLFGDPDLTPGHPVELTGRGAQAGADEEEGGEDREAGRPAPASMGATSEEDDGQGRRRRRRGRGRGRGRHREEGDQEFAMSPESRPAFPVAPEERLEIDGLEEEGGPSGSRPEAPAPREPRDDRPSPWRGDSAPRGQRISPASDNGGAESSHREVFVSTHIVTRPEIPPPPADPGRRRGNPLKDRAAGVESGLIFDSNLGSAQPELPPPPPPPVPEEPRPYDASTPAPDPGHEPQDEDDSDLQETVVAMDDGDEEELQAETTDDSAVAGGTASPGSEPRPRRRRRGRGRRGGKGGGTERHAPAEKAQTLESAEELPDDNIGNIRRPEEGSLGDEEDGPAPGNEKVPAKRSGPPRARSGRGGGRRPRRPRTAAQA